MHHIKTIEKTQEFLVFKIQFLGKYVWQHHPKWPTKDDLLLSKEVSILRETKNEQESFKQEILTDGNNNKKR